VDKIGDLKMKPIKVDRKNEEIIEKALKEIRRKK